MLTIKDIKTTFNEKFTGKEMREKSSCRFCKFDIAKSLFLSNIFPKKKLLNSMLNKSNVKIFIIFMSVRAVILIKGKL